jgi:pyruvate/2-oxoglutarate dehydrogenase complex dihydrolipoamide dehydrogenase (E3) component/uncharacterized membrane protein YdjX (TVP38/TMEM64 family)
MRHTKLAVLVLIAVAIGAAFWFDLAQYLNLAYLKSQQQAFQEAFASSPWLVGGIFFLIYVAVTALSLPGAAVMTLAAGALFGLVWGVVIVSFASTIGATLAFLVARFLLHDTVQQRFGDKLKAINEGVRREGGLYLFTLRLVPIFPFFLINLMMALTPVRAFTFFWVSQVGMLAGTVVYVNAGTQLGRIESLSGLLSPALIGSFVLLGLFPLIAKRVLDGFKARRVYRGWTRPKRFDRNLIVIGAGAAGLVSSYIAAAVKARVTLIERHKMGGDCLNTGCVPSKALIRTARLHQQIREGARYGLGRAHAEVDFAAAMRRVHRVIADIEPHDSVERYTGLGVDVMQGEASLIDPWTVEIRRNDGETQRLTGRGIVLATGAEPFVPPIPGLADAGFLTSDTVWQLTELPRRLVVLGGGPIGSELTQAFARLGASVTQVEMLPRLLPREDPEISAMVLERFRHEGIDVRLDTKATAVRAVDGEKRLVVERAGTSEEIAFDQILVAVGRKARLEGFGLDKLGIRRDRTVEVNDYLQATYPHIFACGDVAGPYQFTHTAAHMAWFCAVNSLFGTFRRFKVDYSVIPWATFTDPEVARVGLNETEAQEQGVPYEVSTYGLDDLDRAICDGEAHGVVKVLTVPGKDRILGVTIAGEHAGDLIAEFVLAMRHGLGLNKILGTIHIYPTWNEANKYVAGQWKQAHKPERVLRWLERYHAWRRG